ncbi:MAG: 30S ribosome-binding factor RbfA [Kiritimatiellae bacterium]|nr:30S ribosome-binding factor RbfA [Kiritimatiellia bacterium]MCO5062316.1 30S ribosome-binding factor RbfA [Kiritimatiellia bacterium]MCO5067164.1 30S ribosome-binding factor RbfA [Kiritimatiellia bacterium]MCO6399657.1 30S ribosome-binding factor RbfA [Verrucomicrobiota bacterium]
MRPQRLTRINQLLRQEVAEQIFRLVNDPDFDAAAVTVTRVITSADLRHARVLVSVRGTPDEQKIALDLIRQQRVELQQIINRKIRMKYTPQLIIELDQSIAQGDQVLSLIAEMEAEHPEWTESEPPKSTGE